MNGPGKIAFLGSPRAFRIIMGETSRELSSEYVIIDPQQPFGIDEKISGQHFSAIIVSDYARSCKFFNEIHFKVVSRIRYNER